MKLKFKKHIRRESRAETQAIADDYAIDDSGGINYLMTFADADSLERNAQDIINQEGLVFADRFGQRRAHPLLCVIRDARSQKLAALKALNLDLEPLKDRPGRPGGR